MDDEDGLLLGGFSGDAVHARSPGCFADGLSVIAIVLAGGPLASTRGDELWREEARARPGPRSLARPKMSAGAGFHGHDARC